MWRNVEYVGCQVCACAVRYDSLCGCMSFTLIVAKDITVSNINIYLRPIISSKSFKSSDALQSFMKNRCKCSQYMFQVKKCTDASCLYCVQHPVHLQKEVFDSLNYLPASFRQYERALPKVFLYLWARYFR